MPATQLPITVPVYASPDEGSSLSASMLYNGVVYVDKTSGERIVGRRPALVSHVSLGTGFPVDGLWWWESKNIALAVSNGRLFKISDKFGTVAEITISGTGSIKKGVRPIFATDGDNTLVATGGTLFRTDGANASYLVSPNDPAGTHVAWKDTYFIGNENGTDRFWWSTVGNNPDTWEVDAFDVAMTDPDPIQAIHTDGRELLMFGTKSIESFYNDGESPWARYDAGTFNVGTLSPYTICYVKGAYIWLNERREVCTPNGRTSQPISETFARPLHGMDLVTDAIGDVFDLGGQTFYVLSFPTANKTYVINLTTGEWQGEWTRWHNGFHERWLGNCIMQAANWNQVLVGCRLSDNIYLASFDHNNDSLGTMRTLYRSGMVTHGSYNKKVSDRLRVRLKRGEVADTTEPVFVLRWRDDGLGRFHNDRELSLGASDVNNYFIDTFKCGQYVSRQYEFEITANHPLFLSGIEETVRLLNR